MSETIFVVSRITVTIEGDREIRATRVGVDGLGQPIHRMPSIVLSDDGVFEDLELGDRFMVTRTATPDGDRTGEERDDND